MIYILSKLIPLLLLPLGLSLILLAFAFIYQRRILIISSLAILWIFSTGIISQALLHFIESPWERKRVYSAPIANSIVVLSGSRHPSPGADQIIEWTDPDRFIAGTELYKAGKAPQILFTGGMNPFYPGVLPEGEMYLKEAKLLGIPSSAMQTTPPLVNTAEEALAIKKLITKNWRHNQKPRVILVTSAFHMKRAKKMFERQGLEVVPFPVDFKSTGRWAGSRWKDPIQWVPNTNSLNSSTHVLREIMGRIVYRAW